MNVLVRPEERVDDLQFKGLKIIQNSQYFSFGMDAVLLARFSVPRDDDIIADGYWNRDHSHFNSRFVPSKEDCWD